MPLHVVVTGAGGFVGGFVAHRFAQRGFTVTAIARRQHGAQSPAGLSWRYADLIRADALPERFDALVHCAAETPARCPDPEALYSGNVRAMRHVCDRALQARARTVLYTSSMSVYGTIAVPVVNEDTLPQDLDPYGRSKLEGERILAKAVAAGLPSALSIRLPGTVGRGSHDNFLSVALARILADEAVAGRHKDALFNNIVYVGHLADFLAAWIASPRPGYAVTNIAACDPIRIGELYSLLFACAGKPERITFSEQGKAPFQISLERVITLGYRPATVRDSVAAFVRDCLSDGEDDLAASQDLAAS
jgi:nucleoside-diphosphate-sugar epimerase